MPNLRLTPAELLQLQTYPPSPGISVRFIFGGGATCRFGNCTTACGVEPKMFRNSIVFCRFENDGIMLPRFNGDGTLGLFDIAEKSGFASGDVKNPGMLVGIVVPVVFDPIDVMNCWAGAGAANATKSIIPGNNTRKRTAHLPRFENRPIQP